jgi:Tfp pilus assembly protein PilF
LIINTDVALIYFIQENFKLAIEKCSPVLEIDPAFAVALFVKGLAYEQLEQYDHAFESLNKAMDVTRGHSIIKGAMVHALGRCGKKEEAEKLLSELKLSADYVSPYTLACGYIGLDDIAAALDNLEKAVDTHSVWLIHLHMKADPRLKPVHENERFKALMKRMGLT